VGEYFEVAWDNWQWGKYENFSKRFTIVKSIRWIGDEIGNYPTYDGTSNIHSFLINMEERVFADQRVSSLDMALKSSPARWWTTHKREFLFLG